MQLEYRYKPIYIYENDEDVPEFVKRIMEHKYVNMRNEVIELLNPHYDEWNKEWDPSGEKEVDESYYKFIASKQEEIFKAFNHKTGGPVFFHADPDCDMYGRFKWNKKYVTMHLELQPVTA